MDKLELEIQYLKDSISAQLAQARGLLELYGKIEKMLALTGELEKAKKSQQKSEAQAQI